MVGFVMKAASDLGIADHVSAKEHAEWIDPLVTVTYSSKAVQGRISALLLTEPGQQQAKIILSDMAAMAQKR